MSAIARLRVLLVVVVVVILQGTLAADVRIDGVHPDLMLLLLAVLAVEGSAERGAVVGLGVGILSDLFLTTPFGLSALCDVLVGFALALFGRDVVARTPWAVVPIAALGTAGGVVVYALLGSLLGGPTLLHGEVLRVAVVTALVNLVLAWPLARILRWAESTRRERPTVGGVLR